MFINGQIKMIITLFYVNKLHLNNKKPLKTLFSGVFESKRLTRVELYDVSFVDFS